MKLTQQRRRILRFLTTDHAVAMPPTARAIANHCGERHRASDWAHGKLREMAYRGLVMPAGVSGFGRGKTWRITDKGRRVLGEE